MMGGANAEAFRIFLAVGLSRATGLVRQPQSVIRPACRDHEHSHRVINFKVCWILKVTRWPRLGL